MQKSLLLFRVLVFTFLYFYTSIVQAQCIKGNCRDGQGTYRFKHGASYEGQFVQGQIAIFGKIIYASGTIYSGSIAYGLPHGDGLVITPDGSQWQGQFINGVPMTTFSAKGPNTDELTSPIQTGCIDGDCDNGRGTYCYLSGMKYIGYFKQSLPDGIGIAYYPDGGQYNGMFFRGLQHGKGTYYAPDRSVTSGEWIDHEFAGLSITRTEGCIAGDCQNGRGEWVYEEGSAVYEGDFVNGKPSGFGTIVYQAGERYVGEWANGLFDGFGMLHRPGTTVIEGNWKKGHFISEKTELIEVEPKHDIEIGEVETDIASEASNKSVQAFAKDTKTWALIIGISPYVHMPVLRYSDDDAYRFSRFLSSPKGGAIPEEQVFLLIDEAATYDSIFAALAKLGELCEPQDQLIVYFSGHGLQGSFLPINFDGYRNKMLHGDIADALNKIKAGYKVLIADACYAGGYYTASRDMGYTISKYYEALNNAHSGTAMLLSSSAEERSLESSGIRQGVFSHFVLKGLGGEADADGDGIVTITELSNFVNDGVFNYTQGAQTPMLSGDFDPSMPVSVVR
jgi:hypothetical protein